MNAIDILGGLLGGNSPIASGRQQGGGGLQDILGGVLSGATGGGRSSAGGGMGFGKKALIGVLGGVAVAALMKKMRASAQAGGQGGSSTSFGGAGRGTSGGLSDMMPDFGDADAGLDLDSREANDEARLLIKAMLNAAKADGRIDSSEEQKILGQLGDIDPEEQEFLRQEIRSQPDARGLARMVPRGQESQVYAMSLLGIELDDQKEAQYLLQLATELNLSGPECNRIHRELGAPEIFS